MQSRAMRMALSVVALLVFGGAAYFLIQSEQQISGRLEAVRVFDQRSRAVSGELSAMRSAQQAYVAAGQGLVFWIPEVATLMASASGSVDELRQSAVSPEAGTALTEAVARISEFGEVDKRVREYLRSGEQLMAADVVFTESSETAVAAGQQVEAARFAEQAAFDAFEANGRRRQAYVLGAAALCTLLIILLLTFRSSAALTPDLELAATANPGGGLLLRETAAVVVKPPEALPRDAVPALKEAALLCTDFGRVNDVDELNKLLGRATEVMDAGGLIVWLGSAGGGDLRPVLSHGYPAEALSQMPAVPRSANNAAAAAYRTGRFQIVLARSGASNGAVVAPLLSPDGCIGALTAEMRGGSETSDSVQALAAIFAAQLTGVLASSVPAAENEDASVTRTAAG
jgi:hypothetical protein